ncbi:winged helix-turn-helix transcriptional regulator [Reyranella sp.]|uniref:winged helix-turn-helix transcriptional regulator n=1 Tax=Reyranella sp. TaxID=1929291 RepID=UPI003F6F7918
MSEGIRYSPGTGASDLSELNLPSRRRSGSAKAISRRAESPSANAVAIIGDRWTFVILRAMFSGAKRFDDMHAQIGIARNILADRLRTSETNGLISRRAYQTRPMRYEYELTEMGRDLYPSTLALVDWANRWIARGPRDKVGLRHLSCKQRLALRVICACCREDISPHDVSVAMADGAQATKTRAKTASPTIRTKTEASSFAEKTPRRLAGPVSVRIRNPAVKR